MSKLAFMIQASQTNERRHVFSPLVDFKSSVESMPSAMHSPMHYVYKLKAEFGCTAIVQYGNQGELDSKLRTIRHQVVNEVFGEFRDDIYAIQRALIDYDTVKAAELVQAMYVRMFDI